jgi:hypothetical protein
VRLFTGIGLQLIQTKALDGLIVALEAQQQHLSSKKTWTRKAYLVTDGEHPLEIEDLDGTIAMMKQKAISLVVVGIDFDDEEFGFIEEEKSHIKVCSVYWPQASLKLMIYCRK